MQARALSGAEPVGRFAGACLARCSGIAVPAALVPLAIDEFPVLFIAAACAAGETRGQRAPRNCGSRRATGSPRWPRAWRRSVSSTSVTARRHAHRRPRQGRASAAVEIDSHGDHRIAMAFAIASLRAREAHRSARRRQRRDLLSGLRRDSRARSGSLSSSGRVRPAAQCPRCRSSPSMAPSGSGKGTVSRAVARGLGWRLLDSGALYRLVALAGTARRRCARRRRRGQARLAARMDIVSSRGPTGEERVRLDGRDVTREIRTEEAGSGASQVAAWPAVRAALLERQRAFAVAPGLVADGRDMGTVVFPRRAAEDFSHREPRRTGPAGAISS